MELRSVRPRGTFHARKTNDPTALNRDGQTFVLVNELESSRPDDCTLEVMFEDGFWMLANPEDIDFL